MIEAKSVEKHYSREDLVERVRTALEANGLEVGDISAEQLEGLDQFHSRGLLATVELAENLQPTRDMRILDIGSGLGGPSRYIADRYGSHVDGIDLSQSFVDAANYLAERVGLQDRVSYRQANALALPFDDKTFDIVWTQHVAMNIADRKGLYSEARRVLKPGGRLAAYDVVLGDAGPLIYPVPWSREPATSFLLTADDMRSLLESLGFEVESWINRTGAAIGWFQELAKRQEENPSVSRPLGLHIAMGEDFKVLSGNLRRNLQEGRAQLLEGIVRRV